MQNRLLEYLKQLHVDTPVLNQALADFSVPKKHTIQSFQAGVNRFIDLANMPPNERASYYGNRFAGLYNNNHLAQLWNVDCPSHQIVTPHSLDALTAGDWGILFKDNCITLQYIGTNPAEALNQMLRGPAVIDCGMFCQLGIWFGIRNILGDVEFNANFGDKPLLLTRFLFEGSQETPQSHLSNPLFEFYSHDALDTVTIEHFFNHEDYDIKHPGGNLQGENSLMVDGRYATFDPLLGSSRLTRTEVIERLLEAFNAKPDSNDKDVFGTFKDNSDFFEDRYGSIYVFFGATVAWAKCIQAHPKLLNIYAETLYNKPECRIRMQEIFSETSENCINDFILAFSGENLANNHRKFKEFYDEFDVKCIFKDLIEHNQTFFEDYYQRILSCLLVLHNSKADRTVSLADLDRPPSVSLDIPSRIHFDFNKFLGSIKEATTVIHDMSCVDGVVLPKKRQNIQLSDVPATLFGGTEKSPNGRIPVSASEDNSMLSTDIVQLPRKEPKLT